MQKEGSITGQGITPSLSTPSDLPTLVSVALECIKGLGEGHSAAASWLGDLRERLASGHLQLAVLGQFKRGKSSLLNALLGEGILPTSVIPLTAIPTFIRHGDTLQATVIFRNGRKPEVLTATRAEDLNTLLAHFVTEGGNPENRLAVSHVDVTHPADILDRGVVLIDTPGIGSTFRHNTDTTLNFLPQCDAALFLVSADPPLTEVEVEFLKKVREKSTRLFVILNKVDYLCGGDRQAALEFLVKVLADQVKIGVDAPVFCVSAKQGLEARLTGNLQLLQQSGLSAVEHHLVGFLASEKSQALREAVRQRAGDVLAGVLMRLNLEMRSLQMPLEDLQQRLGILETKIAEVQQQRDTAGDLLSGDQKRMHEFLEERAENTRIEAGKYLDGIVTQALACQDGENPSDKAIQAALAEAIPGYFEHESGLTTGLIRRGMEEVLRVHQDGTDRLIETIRKTAADLFEIPYHAPESKNAFEMVRKPYWVTHEWSSTLSPIPRSAVEKLLPHKARDRWTLERARCQIVTLVYHNVENFRWAAYQSIDETFRSFGATLDERMADVVAATRDAIRVAVERRRKQSGVVSQEVSRLATAMDELGSLQKALERS